MLQPRNNWQYIPRRLRAVTIQDGKLVVEERPDPEPGKGELLVRVRAARA